jgi:hypothetical protein
MNNTKKKQIVVAGLLLAFMLLAAACSTGQQTTTTSGGTTPTNQTTQAWATLNHVPTGTSDLAWDVTSKTLTVKIWMSGLAPNSSHPAHIHKGNCASDGAIVFPLNPVVADAKGVGTSQTTINGDAKAIPENTWYINVHDGGTGLTPEIQNTPIACGNILNPNASTTSNQTAHLVLGSTVSDNQAVHGNAKLTLDGNKLTVQVVLGGLVPNSTHIAHIHTGSCEAQGAVKYMLSPVVADASGFGTSTTTIDQVAAIPPSGWYVNVHLGGTASEVSTQTGDDPISCGDVVLG